MFNTIWQASLAWHSIFFLEPRHGGVAPHEFIHAAHPQLSERSVRDIVFGPCIGAGHGFGRGRGVLFSLKHKPNQEQRAEDPGDDRRVYADSDAIQKMADSQAPTALIETVGRFFQALGAKPILRRLPPKIRRRGDN